MLEKQLLMLRLDTKLINASTTINFLIKSFTRFGIRETLRADQAPQICGEEMSPFCLNINCRLVSTTPRWPSTNGEVEKQNRSLFKALKIAYNKRRDLKIALSEFLPDNTIHVTNA